MALRSGFSALGRGLAKIGRLISVGSGNPSDNLHPETQNASLRKASKMEEEEIRTRFRVGGTTNNISRPVISPPQQVTSLEHSTREGLITSPAKRWPFLQKLNETRLGRHSEALGSHPIKQLSVPILNAFSELGRGNKALTSYNGKQSSLQKENTFSQSEDGRLGREVEEADRWSTLSNSSTSTVWNFDSSEQDSGSNWKQPSLWGKNSFSESDDRPLGRDAEEADRWSRLRNSSTSTVLNSDSSEQDSSSDQESYAGLYEGSQWGSGMIEPRVTEMTVRVKPRLVRLPYGSTELQSMKSEGLKRELSTWRRQCDTLRGQNSDLQHVVNGIRWAAEDWLGQGPNDQVTGAQAVWLMEEMKDRVRFYEQCCPRLRAAFDGFLAEEDAQTRLKRSLRAKRKNARTNNPSVNSEVDTKTKPSERYPRVGPGIINTSDISTGIF